MDSNTIANVQMGNAEHFYSKTIKTLLK